MKRKKYMKEPSRYQGFIRIQSELWKYIPVGAIICWKEGCSNSQIQSIVLGTTASGSIVVYDVEGKPVSYELPSNIFIKMTDEDLNTFLDSYFSENQVLEFQSVDDDTWITERIKCYEEMIIREENYKSVTLEDRRIWPTPDHIFRKEDISSGIKKHVPIISPKRIVRFSPASEDRFKECLRSFKRF